MPHGEQPLVRSRIQHRHLGVHVRNRVFRVRQTTGHRIKLLQSNLLVQRGCVHQILLLLLPGQRDGAWRQDATLLQTLVHSSERVLEGNQTPLAFQIKST